MQSDVTYAEFILWFLILPATFLVLLAFIIKRSEHVERVNIRRHWMGVGILACIAFVWTTPWDNYLIYRGVWDSAPERIIGRLWYVPIEEYAFFILMPVLNGAVFYLIGYRELIIQRKEQPRKNKIRLIVVIVASFITVFGVWMLSFPKGSYFGLILVWFILPVAIQWFYDPIILLDEKRKVILGTLIPVFYLSAVDRFAIQNGIWEISKDFTTGIYIFSLPIEELFFFFVTSLLLAQGMVLWHGLKPVRIS